MSYSKINYYNFCKYMGTTAIALYLFSGCSKSPKCPETTLLEFSKSQLLGKTLSDKQLSLTFDDGPGEKTAELMEYLATEHIAATFFVVGPKALLNKKLLLRMKELKHLVGNHTESHKQITNVSDPVAEISKVDEVIANYVWGRAFVFRAPFGDWNTHIPDILNTTELKKYTGSIFWDIGGDLTTRYAADWDCWAANHRTVNECTTGYLNEITDKRKGIVLMHDVHDKTLAMIKLLIPKLKEKNFSFVRLDQIPSVANEIRKSGGTPGEGLAEKPNYPIDKPAIIKNSGLGTTSNSANGTTKDSPDETPKACQL